MKIAGAIAFGLALPAAALAGDRSAGPVLRVYVTVAPVEARRDLDGASRNDLKARRDQARDARRTLEKHLREEYGKKRESWPPEKDHSLCRLEDDEALADADYAYRKIDPKGLSDSVQDLMEAFEGRGSAERKERVALATSAAEADLVVEITARRSEKTAPTQIKPDRCYVLFTLGAGPLLDAGRFAQVPADYRLKKFGLFAWTVAGPRPGHPVFLFESYNGGGKEYGCHAAAANAASVAVDRFIEDNYRILIGP
jgi:hypothetical protein